MGFLDKAKSQMAQATAMAKDAAQKGQAKLATMQSKKHSDALLRDLGAIVYGQQTGRPSPTADADSQRLMERLQTHEGQYGQIDLTLEAPATMGGAAMVSSGVPTNVTSSAPAAPPSSVPSAVPSSVPSAAAAAPVSTGIPTSAPSGIPSSAPVASEPVEGGLPSSAPPPPSSLPS